MRRTIVWDASPEGQELTPDKLRSLYRRTFDIINSTLFNGELPPIKIEKGERTEALGFFHAIIETDDDDPEKEPQIIATRIELDTTETAVYGINEDNINVLFHEMAHYYCLLHGIKDTDSGSDYHNLEFKKVIEAHGGKCEYIDPQYGYSYTKLPGDIVNAIFDQI